MIKSKSSKIFMFITLLLVITSVLILSINTEKSDYQAQADDITYTSWEEMRDTTWSVDGDYSISTPAELAQFSYLVSSGNDFDGITVNLTTDIDLGGETETSYEWTPIGNYDSDNDVMNAFCGTFDGGSYLISNIYINNADYIYGSGLFGAIEAGGIVQYVNVEGFNSGSDSAYLGGIAGHISEACIDNCSSDIEIFATTSHCGGIVGEAYHSAITNCVNYGNIIANSSIDVGGIAGCIKATTQLSVIYNCCNYGFIFLSTYNTSAAAGGILGEAGNNSSEFEKVINCYNAAALYETTTGYSYDSNIYAKTTNGHIYAGGIAGSCSYIENCYSTSTKIKTAISDGGCESDSEGLVLSGGIVGWASQWPINCYYYDSDDSQISGNYFGTSYTFNGAGTIDSEFQPDDEVGNVYTYTSSISLVASLNAYTDTLNEELTEAGGTADYKSFYVESGTNDDPIFQPNYYFVTFYWDNATSEETQNIDKGELVTPPDIDVDDGYTLVWVTYSDSGEKIIFDFSTPITSNMEISATTYMSYPTITEQPQDIYESYSGEYFVLSVTATHPLEETTNYELTYSWYKDGVAIAFANKSTYEVKHASANGEYYCLVSIYNMYVGTTSISSDTATVYIISSLIAKPTVTSSNLVYNGDLQSSGILTCDYYTLSGYTSRTNAGTYEVTATLTDPDSHKWEDETTTDVSLSWSIAKADYAEIVWNYTEPFTYGDGQTLVYIPELPTGISLNTKTGTFEESNAGTYTCSYTFNYDSVNYNQPVGGELEWTINRCTVEKPSLEKDVFEYTGYTITAGFTNNSLYTIEGVTSATDIDTYEATITLDSVTNYMWADETDDTLYISWSIGKGNFDMSLVYWSYKSLINTYDGWPTTISLITSDSYALSQCIGLGTVEVTYKDTSATEAGTYYATATFVNNDPNYNDIGDFEVLTWVIEKLEFSIPSAPDDLNYDKCSKSLVYTKSDYITKTGVYSATNAGTYQATFSLVNTTSTCWSDDTIEDITVDWTIEKYVYDTSCATWYYLIGDTYDGSKKFVGLQNIPSELGYYTTYTNNSATNAGIYTASVVFNYNSTNYELSDEISMSMTWEIKKLSIDKSISLNDIVYNGTTQNGITTSEYYTISTGVTEATNAGNYEATIMLNDCDNTQWSDETTDNIIVNWSIAKAEYTDITYEALSGSYTYNITLASYILEDGYSWLDTSIKPTVNVTKYSAIYNVDSTNYEDYLLDIELSLSKKVIAFNFNVPSNMIENGTEYEVTTTITTDIGNDIVTLTLINNKNSLAGNYTAQVNAISNSNYSLPSVCTVNYSILAVTIVNSESNVKLESSTGINSGYDFELTEIETASSEALTTVITQCSGQTAVYSAQFLENGSVVTTSDGYYTLTIPLKAGFSESVEVIAMVDGVATEMECTVIDGSVVFTMKGLNEFMIAETSSDEAINDGLGAGAIIGIVLGSTAVVAAGVFFTIKFIKKKKLKGIEDTKDNN
jgi:hypothetical protein